MSGKGPLLGYNTNIRHRGVLCHVQTEDSGVAHPHVITHLFTKGTILATRKRSYAEHLESTDLSEVVRRMMQDQHKSMCIALRDGEFDQKIDSDQSETQRILVAPEDRDLSDALSNDELPTAPRAAAPRVPEPVVARPKSASRPSTAPPPWSLSTQAETPPPAAIQARPQNLPADTTYRATPAVSGRPRKTPMPTRRRSISPRPEAVFAKTKTKTQAEPASSVFGQDHLSDKSLDEVILAYLSEDADKK